MSSPIVECAADLLKPAPAPLSYGCAQKISWSLSGKMHPHLFVLSSFSRFEKENFQQPPLLLPELEKKISHFKEKNIALEETLRSFQGIVPRLGWGDGTIPV